MATPTTGPRMLRGDEAHLFRDYEVSLRAAVRHHANVAEHIVDDACAFAWLQLCRTQPDRATVFAWLRTVAIRHAWTLAERDRREPRLDALPPAAEPATDTLDTTLEARRALAALAQLPNRQRHYLTLILCGLSHHEISQQTGATDRTINRHLHRARQHLRLVRDPD